MQPGVAYSRYDLANALVQWTLDCNLAIRQLKEDEEEV